MHSRSVWLSARLSVRLSAWLAGKEVRELASARAYWLLLLILGPLAGHAFITAVGSYAEMSGSSGGPAALAQGLSPLDGLIVPTFGAYDLAVTLLFPFVAIRLFSSEKETGALKLLLQSPASLAGMLLVKTLVLLGGWLVAWTPGLIALALWRWYGGHLAAPELATVLLGHLLRGVLTIGVAAAAAAITDNAASAAVVALGVTLGTWALDFMGAVRGGTLARLAAYTPEAALRTFERGSLRASTVLVMLALTLGGLALAAVWLDPGRSRRGRTLGTGGVAAATVALVALGAIPRAGLDASENRRNSFSRADERALAAIRAPLRITVHLAPEDPRLADLDREILRKLERTLPSVRVVSVARTGSGLFEGADAHYGEVWYELGQRRVMSRSTTEPIVLEQIYGLAGITPPAPDAEPAYPGYPLAARPAGAAPVFYIAWPLVVAACWWLVRRPRRDALTARDPGIIPHS